MLEGRGPRWHGGTGWPCGQACARSAACTGPRGTLPPADLPAPAAPPPPLLPAKGAGGQRHAGEPVTARQRHRLRGLPGARRRAAGQPRVEAPGIPAGQLRAAAGRQGADEGRQAQPQVSWSVGRAGRLRFGGGVRGGGGSDGAKRSTAQACAVAHGSRSHFSITCCTQILHQAAVWQVKMFVSSGGTV
jgi:hypothetical protein